jgi:bla regulator protein BlaR1
MTDFMIRFFLCNVLLCGSIGLLLTARRLFRTMLSCRMQYNLWFVLLVLLAVPFLPFPLTWVPEICSRLRCLGDNSSSDAVSAAPMTDETPFSVSDWMNDFTLSVSSRTPSSAGYLLLGVWIAGILVMLLLLLQSALRLHTLRKSALPLQNPKVHRLYQRCLKELKIRRNIPVYSTAFLKSPMITGLFSPCIYLPLSLISDYEEADMKHMLLHELQHYKHKDAFAGFLMNLARTVYWFNPLVWYALNEMHNDREIACDAAVLDILGENACIAYGNTLINFAEKVARTPFPFVARLGGSMKQIKRRIINIAAYKKPTLKKKLKGISSFVLTSLLLFGLIPLLPVQASSGLRYSWKISDNKVSAIDVSPQFGSYSGSFVLYDLEKDHWFVSDRDEAATRAAPNSTYKIYDALFALDAGIISPEASTLPWDETPYPFEAWNKNQNLQSAMASSVNWYFQALDRQLGRKSLQSYIQSIGYGNKNLSGALSSYWMESSLKISPVEQVELLTALYQNELPFTPEHIQAVKDALFLSSSASGALYGKTGTGRIDGQDVNGWFVGFVETKNRTCFFATNISAEDTATGSNAAKITLSILSALAVWK